MPEIGITSSPSSSMEDLAIYRYAHVELMARLNNNKSVKISNDLADLSEIMSPTV